MPISKIECASHDDHETLVSLVVSLEDIHDLASGYVPAVVKANCLGVLQLEDEDRRRAARPVRRRR